MTEQVKRTLWLERWGFHWDDRAPEVAIARYRVAKAQNIIEPKVGDGLLQNEVQPLIDAGITVNIE